MNDQQLNILDVIKKSTQYLLGKGVPNPKCDSEWIVSHVTKKKKLDLYLEFEYILDETLLNKIRELVIKRGYRIPLQHLINEINFAGNRIFCDERALIPRPETEYLCELINDRVSTKFTGKILDLGTGTGAIILALCKNYKYRFGLGVDFSNNALDLAKKNVIFNGADNVQLLKFDWTKDNLSDQYDVIVSNPPYLTTKDWENAEPEVKNFDPKSALVSKNGGLFDIFEVIKHAKKNLNQNGLFAIEIGLGQQTQILEKLIGDFTDVEIIRDFFSASSIYYRP